jgi:energy-coupling factor transporter ATP-binding protein EcfA2
MAFMELAKAKNALSVNVVFLDEMDSTLDHEGSELFVSMVKQTSTENVFIVSHKADLLVDKVDRAIAFELKNNFTQEVQ